LREIDIHSLGKRQVTEATEPAPRTEPQGAGATPAAGQMRVDASELKSSYCNVCNVNSTREEVVLNFGVNHDWDRAQAGAVKLHHRIILSPYAAKRVATLLANLMQDYENRYGTLK
jgi:hypothetical protein